MSRAQLISSVVVDTSALLAFYQQEAGWVQIVHALKTEACVIPAPVLLEFSAVAIARSKGKVARCEEFINALLATSNVSAGTFDEQDGDLARQAIALYGKGRGNRAQLNVIDLMVYGIAKRIRAPILCTGRDFAETDIAIHPASRLT